MKETIQRSAALISRGVERIIDEKELSQKLDRSLRYERPLTIKLGVDPTAPDIHLGHTVPLRKLKHFQELGHDVVFLIGDFTGRIGDPSGRDKTRPPLSEEEILANANTFIRQVSKILDPTRLRVEYNSTWLNNLAFSDIIKMAANTTMSRLLEHNTFRKRLDSSESIRIHEMLYPFMQGYDSVVLKADVELGGSDQTFNLTFGRDLQRFFGQEPQVCITMPILTGTDGVQKMSKSLGNYIGIDEAPSIMFDKIMRMTDANIANYMTLLTDVPEDEIRQLELDMKNAPSTQLILESKKKLAFEVISTYHSKSVAITQLESYGQLDKGGLPELSLKGTTALTLAEWLVGSMGVASKSEARRLMLHGGVRINTHKTQEDILLAHVCPNDIIKIGKLKAFKIVE